MKNTHLLQHLELAGTWAALEVRQTLSSPLYSKFKKGSW